MKRNIPKYADIGSAQNRGPKQVTSKNTERKGTITNVMNTDVIHTHHTTSIKKAAKLMLDQDVRRLPLTNAGTQRLEGIIAAVDLLDFIGGGNKYNIIKEDYDGNFLKAINAPVHKIMEPIQYLAQTQDTEDAIAAMVEDKTSCLPVVDDQENLKVMGIVTERDVLPDEIRPNFEISQIMTTKTYTSSLGMMISDVAKIMVRNRVRRLPVIQEDQLVGIITVPEMLKYLSDGHYKGINVEDNLSTRVEEVMEKNVKTLTPTHTTQDAIQLIKQTGLGGFPITQENQLTGILTITDILKTIK